MRASDQSIESLHKQASAQYLQGNFEDALATWKQILQADPEDERAAEGVRLCELLTDERPIEADAQVDEDLPDVDFGELDADESEDLIELEVPVMEAGEPAGEPAAEPAMPLVAPVAIDQPQPTDPAPPTHGAENPSEMISVVDGIFEDEGDSGDSGKAAASELQKRVGDLIAEAQAAFDGGDTETASGVLARVLILDEANPEALRLQEQIEVEPEEALQLATAEPAAEMSDDPALMSELADDTVFGDDADLDGEIEIDGLTETETVPVKTKSGKFDFRSTKTRWIVIGSVVGVFVLAGAGFWVKLKSIEVRDVPPPRVAGPAKAAPKPETAAAAEPVDPQTALTVAASEEISALVERGKAASNSGDYTAAIVAFDAVLKKDPGNVEAKELMLTATEAYRQQQAAQKDWISAKNLFSEGDYRSALRMFYRLPIESAEERILVERYTENSWYNMGVLALRSRQCEQAREHFNEVAQIDPQDTDAQSALTLADACNTASRVTAEGMPLRGLDDA